MTPHTIFIHCSATQPEWWIDKPVAEIVREFRRWHKGRGWSDIGYHWVISRPGDRAAGRAETRMGAHARGHNRDTLAICLVGGHGSSADDKFSDNFTPEQDKELRALIAELQERYPTIKRVRGHNEVAAKACPGFTVAEWLAEKPPVRTLPRRKTWFQRWLGM